MRSSERSDRQISVILFGLFLLDVLLASWVFFSPQRWAEAFHGTMLIDPHGFLPRMGANWTAFALLQGIAFLKWRQKPYWLLIVAGARLGDMFTDWTYLISASSRTEFALLTLGIASPGNLVAGIVLLKAYLSFSKAEAS